VDAASVRQLADRCAGNPMILRELVSGAMERGALAKEGGIWRLRGGLQPTARLVELVALRLGDLSGAEWAMLELVAVGEPLGQGELAQLADPAAVEGLERMGFITSRMDGRRVQVWLAHPVYGDVVRAGISALRERRIARSLAEVIEAAGGRRREDTLRLATLRLAAGGGSAELLLAGAATARARHDHVLTERLARAAAGEGGGFEARFMAAEAAHFQGRSGQAEQELTALAAEASSDAERARIALVRFDNAFLRQGRADFQIIADAVAAITDQYWRDELTARRLTCIGPGPPWRCSRRLAQGSDHGRLVRSISGLLSAWPGSAGSPRPSHCLVPVRPMTAFRRPTRPGGRGAASCSERSSSSTRAGSTQRNKS
jgi:hypothetical protein